MVNLGKIVIVSALDGDYLRNPFKNGILNLIPKSEYVVKKTDVCCKCYEDASFSKRLCTSKDVELIGGLGTYMPVCRGCYEKKI